MKVEVAVLGSPSLRVLIVYGRKASSRVQAMLREGRWSWTLKRAQVRSREGRWSWTLKRTQERSREGRWS